ncbi:uncharacterized protein L203_101366 [Cryptococcus depauperatus CBS 7841]|uniref:Uncharacterized protein n=1 Tax=Cryptococcus depauperatus CBS 7841 TaxID=1295531 RepID=A0A1E3ICJ0_9TREE|nr:cytoplasmic protein [Cryptococcus depauperatus CBS 7841]
MTCFFPSSRKNIRLSEEDESTSPVVLEKSINLDLPNYEALEDEKELIARLEVMKEAIQDAKIDWYVVSTEDEHQSEMVGDSEKRLEYITGFTGSAGTALIPSCSSEALLFVDSRYWIQAEQQVPTGWKVIRVGSKGGSGREGVVGGWVEWAVHEAEEGSRIGVDPKLISLKLANLIKSRLSSVDSAIILLPLSCNLVDKIRDPLARSLGPISTYPIELSGEGTPSKLARTRDALDNIGFGGSGKSEWIYILPTLPAIAWLLNFRCTSDIPFCPVAYSYVVLTPSRCALFVDERKVEDQLKQRLESEEVELKRYGIEEVGQFVREIVKDTESREKKSNIRIIGPKECNWALSEECSPSRIEVIICPVDTLKAIKNSVEQQNFRNAYLRDGRAMVRWLAWLEKILVNDGRKVGEWAAAQALTRERKKEDLFAGLAYDDISASGPNSALPHYAPKRGKDRFIDINTTYLIDSGAQYRDATIDTTRTLFFGTNPSNELKRAYTRVLQGHIAVSMAKFPPGMTANWMNMLARRALYEDGLDFGHGIGHGVGSYLSVHENPMYPSDNAFKPGNMTTIEPGYYKESEWGIRIESVLLCSVAESTEGPGSGYLNWERITQVPIQSSLVDWSLMAKYEMRWLNEHNKQVQKALEPLLQDDQDAHARDWLKRVCKPHTIWPWDGI